MNRLGLSLLLLLVALASTACIRFEFAFFISDDGSGTMDSTIAFSDEFTEFFGGMGSEDLLADLADDLPANATFRDYAEDGYTGIVYTVRFDDFDDLTDSLGEEAFVEDGEFDISQDADGNWRFVMDLPPLADEVMGDDLVDASMLEFFTGSWVRIRVSLPGELVEHNADHIENENELVWNLDLQSSEPVRLSASSSTAGPGLSVGWIVGIVVAAVAAIGAISVVVIFMSRRKANA